MSGAIIKPKEVRKIASKDFNERNDGLVSQGSLDKIVEKITWREQLLKDSGTSPEQAIRGKRLKYMSQFA